jgi:hypothetical protein
MTRRELAELPDAELVTRCAAPIVRRLHIRDTAERHPAIRHLSRNQGALLAFWILYSHTQGGLISLCTHLPHRVVDEDFWTLVDEGLGEIQDANLLALLHRLRIEISLVISIEAVG